MKRRWGARCARRSAPLRRGSRGCNKTEQDFAAIRDELSDALRSRRSDRSAFTATMRCSSAYAIVARTAQRARQVVALMLITVQGPDGGRAPEGEALAETMDDLKLAIAGTLRKSDTFTKYSRSQYALLLPMESADDMAVVERRLSAAYESARTQAAAFLEFRGTVLEELYG
ncbi:MAG: hypothetical protein ACLRZH_03050 [Ruthenibacterium lactatiformans]